MVLRRACLKPMQPIRLHWAPRLWGPAPLVAPRFWGPRAMCLDSNSFLPNTPYDQIQQKRLIKSRC